MNPLLVASIGALLVMAVFFGLWRLSAGSSDVKGRLARFAGDARPEEEQKSEKKQFTLGLGDSALAAKVEKSVGKQTFGRNVQRKLAQADLKLTLFEFMLIKVALMAVGLAVGAYMGRGGSLQLVLFSLAGVAIGFSRSTGTSSFVWASVSRISTAS